MWTIINIKIHIDSTLLSHLHKHTVSATHVQPYRACEFMAPVTIYNIIGNNVLLYYYLNITRHYCVRYICGIL